MRKLGFVCVLIVGATGCAAEATSEAQREETHAISAPLPLAAKDQPAAPRELNVLSVAEFVGARSRLPSDAVVPQTVHCEDPVAGTWVSREHFAEYGDWYRFELRIRRGGEGETLTGEIGSRSWSGTVVDAVPPACSDATGGSEHFDWSVRMPAEGHARGDEVIFDGKDVVFEPARCGAPAAGYLADRFHGHAVGPDQLVLTNNDGGRSENDLHLFRRVSCE